MENYYNCILIMAFRKILGFKAAKDNDGKYCFYDLVSKQFFYPISGNLTGEDLP